MKHQISYQLTEPFIGNLIPITSRLYEVIGDGSKQEWKSLFNGFRLNLASRIAGSDESELLKLQAKIENVNELETFFQNVISSPVSGK